MSGQLNITVRPEVRLDAKWLKMDLQRFLSRDGLAELWNEMIRDGEIVGAFSDGLMNSAGVIARKGELDTFVFIRLFTAIWSCAIIAYYFAGESGHYYCNLRVLSCPCCDGICGPQNGCNCIPCQKLDDEDGRIVTTEKSIPAQYTIDSWLWGSQPC